MNGEPHSVFDALSFNLCAVTDLDVEGMRSVTNDIEHVLELLVRRRQLVPGHPRQYLVYRDSEQQWDRVVIDADCRFVRFASLGIRADTAVGRDPRLVLAALLIEDHRKEPSP